VNLYRRLARWAGPAAVGVAWGVIALAVAANPGFSWAHGALSDLGAPGARRPWIYDDGMILTGILLMAYATHLVAAAELRLGAAAGTLFGVAGQFLGLVGLYPMGTSAHNFVSLYFFLDSALAVTLWGVAEAWRGRHLLGLAYGVLGAGGVAVGLFVPFSSVAWRETFGVLAIDTFGLVSFWDTGRRMTP
jgi:hypothetical membrane protein